MNEKENSNREWGSCVITFGDGHLAYVLGAYEKRGRIVGCEESCQRADQSRESVQTFVGKQENHQTHLIRDG